MRIAYVILTCEKYWNTRVPWQKETCFSTVLSQDIYYLGHMMNEDQRLFNWGAQDDYHSLPHKMLGLFQHLPLENYDWICIADDDTYIYTSRLEQFLSQYAGQDYVACGHRLDHVQRELFSYFSGGAGTVFSQGLYIELRHHVAQCPSLIHWCADICLGRWLIDTKERLSRENTIVIDLHSPMFHPEYYNPATDHVATAITFHHLKEHRQYQELYTQDK